MQHLAAVDASADYLARGLAAFDLGRADEALASAEAGLAVATADADRFDLQRLAIIVLHRLGRLREAYELAEDVLPLSPTVSQASVADIAAILGGLADQLGDPGLAIERTGLALELLAAASPDDSAYLRATHNAAFALHRFGAHRLAVEMLSVGLDSCPPADRVHSALAMTLAAAELRVVETESSAVDVAEQEQRLTRALDLARPYQDGGGPRRMVEAATVAAYALLGLDRAIEAQRALEAASGSAALLTDAVIVSDFELARARTYRTRGKLAAAAVGADRAVAGAELAGDPVLSARALEERSKVAEARGDVAAALADLRAASAIRSSRQAGRYDSLMRQVQHRAALRAARHDAEERATALAKSVNNLRTLVTHDHLTGLPNRRAFDLDAPLTAARTGVIMADIDHFKAINDSRGHLIGDAALQLAARTITRALGDRARAYRWGGEEFLVIVADDHVAATATIADELRAAIVNAPWFSVAPGLLVTMSVGVAIGPAESLRGLVAQADAALYRAKAGGRDQVAVAAG